VASTADKIDCILMKRSIQEQISKEMSGMSPAERLVYIKRQVQKSLFSDEIRRGIIAIRKSGHY
jgi:hypothetical protein